MSIKMNNRKSMTDYIKNYGVRIDKALIYQLKYTIEVLSNHAKQNAEFVDDTGNLKASIGGVLLKNGRILKSKGFDTRSEGGLIGYDYIDSLTKQFTSGYVILIVAGMEYATYVENYHGLNVLKKSELLIDGEINKIALKMKFV